MPSSRIILWGVVFGLLAVFLTNNVAFVGNITRSRS
jgi:hypothetical protein